MLNCCSNFQSCCVLSEREGQSVGAIPEYPVGGFCGFCSGMSKLLPRCPRCEQTMRWVRSLPAFAGHPELQSFACRGCREALTISIGREASPNTAHFSPKAPCIGADADPLRTQQRRFRERHYVGPVLLGAIGEDYQSHPWEQPVNSAFYQSLKGAIKSGSLVSA